MFCPKCRGEYVEGVKRCPNCEVDLIEALEPEPKEEFDYAEYVTVYSTADPAIIALAESLLDADNIRYSIKSEGLQTILGLGIVQ
ncbi:MAG: hypothetical protein KAS49_04540, partial [Candidatus Cloacimonetes bacterium]|nr:hypothetical protein [Candidatus Cloacimonadota bacterium]